MMWRARMETPNFEFVAYGKSKGDARAVLRAGLEKHAEQYGIASDWWSSKHGPTFDIHVAYIADGECYRNNELLRERA
jgi:hypothetical protein